LNSLFNVFGVQYGGLDGSILKVMAVAKRAGLLNKEHLGLQIMVKSKEGALEEELSEDEDPVELCNEVKRLGFLVDRKQPL